MSLIYLFAYDARSNMPIWFQFTLIPIFVTIISFRPGIFLIIASSFLTLSMYRNMEIWCYFVEYERSFSSIDSNNETMRINMISNNMLHVYVYLLTMLAIFLQIHPTCSNQYKKNTYCLWIACSIVRGISYLTRRVNREKKKKKL